MNNLNNTDYANNVITLTSRDDLHESKTRFYTFLFCYKSCGKIFCSLKQSLEE